MAKFRIEGADQLIKDYRKYGTNGEAAAIAIVQAAADEVVGQWQDSATRFGHVDTGAMIRGIKATTASADGNGIASEVYPRGKDKRGTRNATKAFILNYGSSKIRPSHWVEAANESAEPVVTGMMESMWASFMESGTVPGGGLSGAAKRTKRSKGRK